MGNSGNQTGEKQCLKRVFQAEAGILAGGGRNEKSGNFHEEK